MQTNYFKCPFFPQTIVAWNALPKSVSLAPHWMHSRWHWGDRYIHTDILFDFIVGCSPFSRSVLVWCWCTWVWSRCYSNTCMHTTRWSSLDLKEFKLGAVTTSSHRLFHRLVLLWRKNLVWVLVLQRSLLSLWECPLVVVLVSRCCGSCSVLYIYICCVWICGPHVWYQLRYSWLNIL